MAPPVSFVMLLNKELVSVHTKEQRRAMAGRGTPEVPCSGYSQSHYRRAISPLRAQRRKVISPAAHRRKQGGTEQLGT